MEFNIEDWNKKVSEFLKTIAAVTSQDQMRILKGAFANVMKPMVSNMKQGLATGGHNKTGNLSKSIRTKKLRSVGVVSGALYGKGGQHFHLFNDGTTQRKKKNGQSTGKMWGAGDTSNPTPIASNFFSKRIENYIPTINKEGTKLMNKYLDSWVKRAAKKL